MGEIDNVKKNTTAILVLQIIKIEPLESNSHISIEDVNSSM